MDVHTEKEYHRDSQREQKENKEQGSGRPRAGSESSRNPVSKVMDLIRHRSHSALSAEDKRKAVSNSLRLYLIIFHLSINSIKKKYFELRRLCTNYIYVINRIYIYILRILFIEK